MDTKTSLLESLKRARTEEEITRLGFVRGAYRVVDWPKNIRERMRLCLESGNEAQVQEVIRRAQRYTRETFHPKDALLCLFSQDSKKLFYPSIRYRKTGDNRLRFENVGVFEKDFTPTMMINAENETEISRCSLFEEVFPDSDKAKAAITLLNGREIPAH